jgi:hypothetical protein
MRRTQDFDATPHIRERCDAAASPLGAFVRPKLAQGTHDSRSTDSHYLAEETQRWR